MRKETILLSLLVSAGCYAQTEVSGYQPGKNSEGVTYFLPQTIINVTVKAEKTTYTPGDLCRYAEKYLRLTGISTSADEQWAIRSIAITPVGKPDPEKAFTIKLRDRTVAPLVELTPDGIIKAINTSSPETPAPAEQEEKSRQAFNPRNYLTEEILMAGSTAKMAELAAKEIFNIRESKNAITRGQAENMPKDGESLRIMLNSLEEQEQALLQLFTGTTVKETRTYTVSVTPTGNINKEVLFRFSKKLGILSASDLAGAPVYLTLTDRQTVPQATEEEKAKKKWDGVVYNIPGKADIRIDHGTKNIYQGEIMLSQFGNSEVLSNNLFNRKTTTKVLFDPTTGGLVKIEAEE